MCIALAYAGMRVGCLVALGAELNARARGTVPFAGDNRKALLPICPGARPTLGSCYNWTPNLRGIGRPR